MDKMGSRAAVFSIIYIYFIGNCLSVNFNLIAADANQGNVSMQDGSKDINKTVKAMIYKALNAMTAEADNGAFAWVAEMANSTWNSNCSRHDDENETFL